MKKCVSLMLEGLKTWKLQVRGGSSEMRSCSETHPETNMPSIFWWENLQPPSINMNFGEDEPNNQTAVPSGVSKVG
jgi:hypothetical protein